MPVKWKILRPAADNKKQAGIIRTQGEMTELVTDLNLTTKLSIPLQPIKKQPVNPVELARQVVSEFLNNGLEKPVNWDL